MAKKTDRASELNWHQIRFVRNYVHNGGKAGLAYFDAYGNSKTGSEAASRLLKDVRIQERIKLEQERLHNALDFKKEDALRMLVGMAKATIDDFTPILKKYKDRESYKDLGDKVYAIKSVKNTDYGVAVELVDRLAIINELWDKLGLGEGVGKANWFDGFDQLAELVRGTKKEK